MGNMHYLNLETVPMEALRAILEIDKGFIGTPHYMGVAFFWNYDYRHFLRDASVARRRDAHSRLLDAGLSVCGSSDAHFRIMTFVCR